MSSTKTPRNKSVNKRRTRSYRKPNAWQVSDAWRRIGSEAIRAFNAKRHLLPKCGARAKSTGEPCRQLALENGRCRWHGGRTPKGKQHGVRQFTPKPPSRQTRHDWPRAQGKINRFAHQDTRRRRRVAMMTPEEFATYFRLTHARHDREFRRIVDAEMRRRGLTRNDIMPSAGALVFDVKPAVNPEVAALEVKIERLQALQAEIQAAKIAGDQVGADQIEAVFNTQTLGSPPSTKSAPASMEQDGGPPGAETSPGSNYPRKGVFA